MNISAKGITFLHQRESCRLHSYLDTGGVWTVGWGHTATACKGQYISQAAADLLFLSDLAPVEKAVNDMVKVPLRQGQYDALVSLAFNIGISALRKSTLMRLLNAGDYLGASAQFLRWDMDNGKHVPGLLNRRKLEQAMFNA